MPSISWWLSKQQCVHGGLRLEDPWMTFLSPMMIGLGELPWIKESLPLPGASPQAI